MKIGFIGAGRAGVSLGKYLAVNISRLDSVKVSGFYSLHEESAKWAADFTESTFYRDLQTLTDESDTIVISTPDRAVKAVWDSLTQFNLRGKIICHLSGSLSSDVFSRDKDMDYYPVSVHPLFAFCDKESTYKQLNNVGFTLEGHPYAVKVWENVFKQLGNNCVCIKAGDKAKYHCAASILSNHVLAVLQTGYSLLNECGFTEEEARSFTSALVLGNVENAIFSGCVNALTGPIERGDENTIISHLSAMDEAKGNIYRTLGQELVLIAGEKNPDRDYSNIKKILAEN